MASTHVNTKSPLSGDANQRTHLSRRRFLGAGAAGLVAASWPTSAWAAPAEVAGTVDPAVAAIEQSHGTAIGLVAKNLRTGRSITHRPDERQPLCSTFKPLVAAALLQRGTDLDQVVRYRTEDLVTWSPITGERRSMTIGGLADAAIRYSDNTAGNLLLHRLGGPDGPAALTRFLREIGDDVSRLDRWETDLNEAVPGDRRDTTTPRALAATYRRLLHGDDVLTARDRWVLTGWMQANTTSVARFRAGLPAGWWCADKTGSGAYGVMNDAGTVTSPDGTEIVFAILTRRSTTDPAAAGDPTLMKVLAAHITDRLGE